MKAFPWLLLLLLFGGSSTFARFIAANDPETLAIGAPAPDFKLPGTDGKTWTLAAFKNAKILVVVFTCNHCPTAQAYEDRLIRLTSDYSDRGVAVVAISPNDPRAIRLNELDYTDLNDSFEEMKIRADRKKYNFPYLYDGDNQQVSRSYGPVATPHVFVFDSERKLRFQGRIDNMEKPSKTPTVQDTRNAIEALLNNLPVAVSTTKVFGCSVKWAEKTDWLEKAKVEWAKEPVELSTISTAGIKDLLKNNSGKLRLINVWATWCGPCTREFPDFITINRMYRGRDFEFISISADDPANREKVLSFLKKQQASVANYLFDTDDKYALIEAIDPNWQGALPYTILVEPGGKIVYARQGAIDASAMKTTIVDHPLIGRYFR
ncbi:redoxin domain-containing protein [Flavihumibacter stibioxidans]|uniref:Redoxin n=1 Tax=Flavihumibacter stibioxidans TaxID=1834163 RepID=A0ABR7MCV0_9BACT|nr:redoxin domain-containing protein [Flavihumibacter stibioxidans]MBC6492580.1 redoxin [Flavihumibacter stibioxidans]